MQRCLRKPVKYLTSNQYLISTSKVFYISIIKSVSGLKLEHKWLLKIGNVIKHLSNCLAELIFLFYRQLVL